MIVYSELKSDSLEFHEAYAVISMDIEPEFVEPEEYVRERFRVQEQGAKTDEERRMIPEGYCIHMIAAKEDKTNKVVGAIYTNFIPKIGSENTGFALVSYLAVLPEYRRGGIGTRLVEEVIKPNHADSLRITGKPAVGLLFEIEDEGKEEIAGLVRKMGGQPLDIDYYQPSVREGSDEQPMNLWLLPLDKPIKSNEEAKVIKHPAAWIHDMVKSLFVYEYPGPDRSGFKETSKAYQALVSSLKGRNNGGL
jgi:GNAT superfamily N-acetyltransferase